MAINERISDLGYFALKKEVTKGTPLTPTVFLPMYDDGGMSTDLQLEEINPIIGTKFARYTTIMGLRKHGGSPILYATPNSVAYLTDMMMTKGTLTTPNYTYPFTIDKATNPNSYTVDISDGLIVSRFTGVEASEIKPVFSKNEIRVQPKLHALHSFIVREVATWTSGTKTVTLSTKYDPAPTLGLVAGDSVQFSGAGAGATPIITTVGTVSNDGITFTVADVITGLAAGDFVTLSPQTVSLVSEIPFGWGRTEFHFGSTASAALAASHTPCEQSTEVTIMHTLENDQGAMRSGSYDPASLVRKNGDATGKIKRFFASMDEMNRFLAAGQNPQALVVRMYSGSTYEWRIVLDQIVYKAGKKPVKTGTIVYQEFDIIPVYNVANGEGMNCLITCAIASL